MTDGDHYGDWRIRTVVRLMEDIPATPEGAPSHRAGTGVFLLTEIVDDVGAFSSFVTPSTEALTLNIAMKADAESQSLRQAIEWRPVLSPRGLIQSVTHETHDPLFSYFEACMVCVTFSFQAIEAYCNHTITDHQTGRVPLQRRDRNNQPRTDNLTAEEVERRVSTDEKLSQVLPTILSVTSPRGRQVWEKFRVLKNARDATVHIKGHDQYPRPRSLGDADVDSLLRGFLLNGVSMMPEAAIAMIYHFERRGAIPRWLQIPMAMYRVS